jgi:hypothetical protein
MRAFNRVLSLLLATVLIGGGLLAAAEAIAALVGRAPLLVPAAQWADDLRSWLFADLGVQMVLSIVSVVALTLFVAEVWPWPKRLVPLDQDEYGWWWLHRRSVEEQVRRMVSSATVATKVRARLQPQRAAWELRVDATAAPQAREDIEQRARALLAQLGGPQTASVTVRIHPRRDGRG